MFCTYVVVSFLYIVMDVRVTSDFLNSFEEGATLPHLCISSLFFFLQPSQLPQISSKSQEILGASFCNGHLYPLVPLVSGTIARFGTFGYQLKRAWFIQRPK